MLLTARLLALVALLCFHPAWASAQGVCVLLYHDIVDSETSGRAPGLDVITLPKFKEQMDYLAAQGFTTLSMQELVDFMQGKTKVPGKSVVITFDDGWRSQLKILPILAQHHFKASFWIITGEGFGDSYMTDQELLKIDGNPDWQIGSHTKTHPWHVKDSLLTWLNGQPQGRSADDVRRELVDSKAKLEKLLHHPITMLAWPCGWYNQTLIKMAQEAGYTALLTTIPKPNYQGTDILQVRRFDINGLYTVEDLKRILAQSSA